ncbi:TPA: ead/Ea22-like family protein [Escherichia coli]
MIKINYQELREAAEQATQDEWVAYILPGHNGIYPARTSEGRHCGYFIDWPGVCQGRESISMSISMSIRTYAVNCNDAWLNTEGDDISGSYVKYKDHQEVVAALEAKCAALAAENAVIKSAIPEPRDNYEGVISDGSKRIAKLESNEVREDGNQFLVVRHPGKTPVIKHCTGDLEEFLRQLIEQDPLVTIDIITHRYYGVGGQWVQDAGEYLHMMSDAGIRIKGGE